jgi:hypothetical protein
MASIGTTAMTKFENTPAHYLIFANQTLEWLPTDTEENYKQLIQDPKHREYFAAQGWDQPGAITYRFNRHGFRADEFDSGPYMVALGCSYTVGIGLPDSATWARLTATELGLKCANLAWGGYSADTCYRLAEYWVPALRPAYVCMLVPPRARLELLLDTQLLTTNQLPVEVFMPQSQSQSPLFNNDDTYLKHWFLNEENAKINQRKNVMAIRQLCADLDIPCTVIAAEQHMCLSREEIGYARDYMHGGPKIHTTLAQQFVAKYRYS